MRKSLAAFATVMLVLPVLGGATPASATDTGTVTQVTNGDAKSTVPTITGDGSSIAFHSSAGNLPGAEQGQNNIDNSYRVGSYGAGYIRYTAAVSGVASGLGTDISNNGQWVVYTKGDDVYRNNAAGTGEQVVAAGNAASGWFNNANGARVDDAGNVVFHSLASDLVGGDTNDGQWDIFYWNGSSTVRISNGDVLSYLNPDVSANGTVIAYNSATVNGADISGLDVFIGGPTSGGPTNRTGASNNQSDLPRVNNDGSKVAFRSNSTDLVPGSGTFNVFTWGTGDVFTRVTNYGDASVTNPAISGDGAYVAYQYGSQIYRSAAATNGATIQLSAHTGSGVLINYPSVNNDGSKVAYAQSTDDTVAGVEILLWNVVTYCAFNNPVLNTEYQAKRGTDGLIARLYAAYYQRNPDAGGYLFWQQQIAAGRWTNDHAASFFGESPEFVALYGASLTNAQFVDRLYANVMCRDAGFDPSGRAYWIDRMNKGATRGTIALFFSDSAEFRGRVQHPLQG
jgi:Tol biopolymer transport system component